MNKHHGKPTYKWRFWRTRNRMSAGSCSNGHMKTMLDLWGPARPSTGAFLLEVPPFPACLQARDLCIV